MARSDTLRTELARLKSTEADLRKEVGRQEDAAAKARAEAAKKREAAARTRSDSTRRTYLRGAEAEETKLASAEKKAGDVMRKLGDNAKAQASKTQTLAEAERSEQRARDLEDGRRRRKEKDHARELDRQKRARNLEDERRRNKEREHAREVARLSRPTVRYIHVAPPEPERLRLLYLTASPFNPLDVSDAEAEASLDRAVGAPSVGLDYLRVDAEVRMVREALKKSLHRDLVQLDHRSAATPEDLIDGMNEIKPHVVHFSGHAGQRGVVFDNGSVDGPQGRDVDLGLLAEILTATDTPPRVLVLNACDTLDGAEVILPAVPVVVAMADTVSDLAASVFATRFYSAIASGQSVGAALRQGRAGIRLADLGEDADLPEFVVRDDVDVDGLVLVQPPLAA